MPPVGVVVPPVGVIVAGIPVMPPVGVVMLLSIASCPVVI